MGYTQDKLQIFTAGVAKEIVAKLAEEWNKNHSGLKAEFLADGSVDLIRKILNGERCDVLVVADDTIIKTMMMPELAEGYIVFAGNRMVITAKGEKTINSENWKDVLMESDTTFAHKNPYADPGGYRGLMALMLAEKYEKGLGGKLLNHPGHIGMDPALTLATLPPHDFLLEYYSGAANRGAQFARLPEIMDQSEESLAEEYKEVSFDVDDNNSVTCTPIRHAITIPAVAVHRQEAQEFLKLFLDVDFKKFNFLEKREVVGKSILE